jgi:UDP-hydrolysing UDP-N-acetyl-D-glucosamine 2-epimerase
MIGPEHLPHPAPRSTSSRPLRVAVVTGSRAEFGLLRPVMHAVRARPELELLVLAAGAHLIQPALTFREVKREFEVADSIPMQIAGRTGRIEDAEALARGVARFTRSFDRLRPDWTLVLGDRIEPFAAACAAAVGGFALAHVHGGDRAEGVADESMRHAISKLAHLHFPATPTSAHRLVRMGEPETRVHTVGSPGVDELASFAPLADDRYDEMGRPEVLFLMHPVGRHAELEEAAAAAVLAALQGRRVLALHPNFDPGRQGILRALSGVPSREHLPRAEFVGLLKRLAQSGGVLVGNSSAGLIEGAVLGVRVVNVGPRQNGREHAGNVVQAGGETQDAVARALREAQALDPSRVTHPYGDGNAGKRIAAILADTDPRDPTLLRKLCTY